MVHVLGPVLATMERSGVLIIGFVMANLPYIQSFRSLELSGRPNNVSVVNYFVSVVHYFFSFLECNTFILH